MACAYTSVLGIPRTQSRARSGAPAPNGPLLSSVIFELFAHPQRILILWNWKSALLSIVLRGPIFLIAAIRQGSEAAAAALLTESVFCAISAGFYGAIVQTLRDAEPQWLTGVFLTLVVPAAFQGLEYGLHRFRGTPHLRLVEFASIVVSAVSALFNWYAMRQGTFLVGEEGRSLGGDLRRLPRLLFDFVVLLPRRFSKRYRAGDNLIQHNV
jgi:hypothetical protein